MSVCVHPVIYSILFHLCRLRLQLSTIGTLSPTKHVYMTDLLWQMRFGSAGLVKY